MPSFSEKDDSSNFYLTQYDTDHTCQFKSTLVTQKKTSCSFYGINIQISILHKSSPLHMGITEL